MEATTTNRVKLTGKVKRGLVLARGLILDSLNPDASHGYITVGKWKRSDERDLNAALAWMEQVEADIAAKAEVVA